MKTLIQRHYQIQISHAWYFQRILSTRQDQFNAYTGRCFEIWLAVWIYHAWINGKLHTHRIEGSKLDIKTGFVQLTLYFVDRWKTNYRKTLSNGMTFEKVVRPKRASWWLFDSRFFLFVSFNSTSVKMKKKEEATTKTVWIAIFVKLFISTSKKNMSYTRTKTRLKYYLINNILTIPCHIKNQC